jgi:DNA-binding FrmR family transcriptional regulator
MRLDEGAMGEVVKRLRRAEGQIRGVIAMLESGRECTDVVAMTDVGCYRLDRAGFKIISSGLQQCLNAQAAGEDASLDLEQMEKLFLALA